MNKAWRAHAACAYEEQPDVMFPDPGAIQATEDAIAVCAVCPVKRVCLETALVEERGQSKAFRYGVRGGQTPGQRYAASKHQRQRAAAQGDRPSPA